MNYALLKYNENHINIGDYIQSLAAEQFLPRVDALLDRDRLNRMGVNARKTLVIMNGWFTLEPGNWPPSEQLAPVFHGFHMADREEIRRAMLSERSIAYFRRHEPVGCRERVTAEALEQHGVRTFVSRCPTLTFRRRPRTPRNGLVFLVDADRIPLPRSLERGAVRVSHILANHYSDETCLTLARDLLETYRSRARLVVTTRLHCALPCVAMGIPVVFFSDPDEYRVAWVRELGLTIYPPPGSVAGSVYRVLRERSGRRRLRRVAGLGAAVARRLWGPDQVDWNPVPPDLEHEKARMAQTLREMIEAAAARALGHGGADFRGDARTGFRSRSCGGGAG